MSDNMQDEEYLIKLRERYNELLEREALFDLIELNKKPPLENRVIRVGFLCQDPGLWDNIVSIYDKMIERKDFCPVIIVIPPIDYKTMNLYLDYDTNYFIGKYPDALRAYNDNLEILDLKTLDLDYLFYPRQYDGYIPDEYRSVNTIKYVKNCYVPYAYTATENALSLYGDASFFRNMYFLFMESEYTRDFMTNLRGDAAKKGLQKILAMGYPALETFFNKKTRENVKTILWTPRWSYDEKYGGSHFLEYRDMPIKLKQRFPDKDIIFRPHPLLFDEMVKKGFMTNEEMESYLIDLRKYGVVIDTGTPFYEAFEKADLLITDLSSIMIHWFFTGKPMIYCPGFAKFYGFLSEIEECSYTAFSYDEIFSFTDSILEGNDERKAQREALILKGKTEHLGATDRIVEAIAADYFKNF